MIGILYAFKSFISPAEYGFDFCNNWVYIKSVCSCLTRNQAFFKKQTYLVIVLEVCVPSGIVMATGFMPKRYAAEVDRCGMSHVVALDGGVLTSYK